MALQTAGGAERASWSGPAPARLQTRNHQYICQYVCIIFFQTIKKPAHVPAMETTPCVTCNCGCLCSFPAQRRGRWHRLKGNPGQVILQLAEVVQDTYHVVKPHAFKALSIELVDPLLQLLPERPALLGHHHQARPAIVRMGYPQHMPVPLQDRKSVV